MNPPVVRPGTSPRLLISVRDPAEAADAVLGGADLIDVKDPARGSLGRADVTVTSAVIETAAGRRPVSAALGELAERRGGETVPAGVLFVKWGLAGCAGLDWRRLLAEEIEGLRNRHDGCQLVPAAYADWKRAKAPPVEDVAAFAREHDCPALLIDTFVKDGRSLLDWLTELELSEIGRIAEVPLALAGSLTIEGMKRLMPLNPGWFAVRGAACRDGRRDERIERGRVEELAAVLNGVIGP